MSRAGQIEPQEPPPAGRRDSREERHVRRLERRQARREMTRRRILKTTAILPSLFTLGNGLLGFAAIYLAMRGGVKADLTGIGTAAWLLFAAMVCDMLDGRLARFTRRTSDFGAQLDSMCDVISFGVAPPLLMMRTVLGAVHGTVEKVAYLQRLTDIGLERLLWCVAGVYVAGAALRLARFNVENEPDESAHMHFRGLPSPGAAAGIATFVLLFDHLMHIDEGGWLFGPWLLSTHDRLAEWMCAAITVILPVLTAAVGLLMVSRFRYAHVVNQYIRGKRPFTYLVKLVVVVLATSVEPFVALAGAATVYVLSAPLASAWNQLRRRGAPPGSPPASEPARPGRQEAENPS